MPKILTVLAALTLAACGEEPQTYGPTPRSSSTVFIHAEGMVQSLGIT